MRQPDRHVFRKVSLALCAVLVCVAATASCRAPAPRPQGPPTQIERLMQAYTDLRDGRFVVIADFEDPTHMELVQLISVSDEARCTLNQACGRAETGTGCLLLTAGSPYDTIVLNNTNAANWHMKQDWRPFDLLLLSVHSPKRDLALEITVAGGPPDAQAVAGATVTLGKGWTVARIDLAQIGERVPLDDVREIRLTVSGASRPVRLSFDDILLTSSRKTLFGDPMEPGTGLYVQEVGRRWKVGAGGAGSGFELTFANGRIAAWHNVATDPHRIRNLVRGTTLGPTPVVVGSPDANERDFLPFGRAVVARSRIVEMNVVRTVITCVWHFVDDPEDARGSTEGRPFQRWVYTVYPTGQVYVAVEATVVTPTWSTPPLGLSVALAPTPDDEIHTHGAGGPAEAEASDAPPYATARSATSDAFVLFVVDETRGPVRFRSATIGAGEPASDDDVVSLIAVQERDQADVQTWLCHVLVGSSSMISDDEARTRAAAYVRPAPPRVDTGTLAAGGPEPDNVGFDPSDGCFVIAPDEGRVRFWVDGTDRPQFSPRFKVLGRRTALEQWHQAWVYVDDVILEQVARDAEGNLIFQLPGIITESVAVDVLFGP